MNVTFSRLPASQSFSQWLLSLTTMDLEGLFGSTILARGQDYYYSDRVKQVSIRPGAITAKVIGSEYYDVFIRLVNNAVQSGCDCPYESACKHQAALLLYLNEAVSPDELLEVDQPAVEAGATSKEDAFEEYLFERSPEELRQLVRDFAPASFRESVRLQNATPKRQVTVLYQVNSKIEGLLGDELYDIELFETALMEMVEPLRGLWQKFPREIAELMATVITSVDDAFEEGYLYDHYGDYNYQGNKFGSYMAEFVAALSGKVQAQVLDKIQQALNKQGYGTHENFYLEFIGFAKAEDLYALRAAMQGWGRNSLRLLYEKIQPLFSEEEQEVFLKEQAERDNWFVAQLADFYEKRQQLKQAIQLLDAKLKTIVERPGNQFYFFSSSEEQELFEKRLELEHRYQQNTQSLYWAKTYLATFPTVQAINFVLKFVPEHRQDMEKMLESRSPQNYAKFLEEEQRLQEVLRLFEQYPDKLRLQSEQYNFFRKYKRQFPGSAKTVFETVLEDHLPDTGDRAYYAVAEALQQLKAVEDPADLKKRVDGIKSKYYRRRKLRQILEQAGL